MSLRDLQQSLVKQPLPMIFGGSFRPFHRGHTAIVETLQTKFPSCPCILLPNRISPLKLSAPAAFIEHRVALMQAVLEDLQTLPTAAHAQTITLELCELEREGPSYTVDTLAQLLTLETSASVAGKFCLLVMGWDSFCSLPLWKDWRYLLDICIFVVFRRKALAPKPDSPIKTATPPLPEQKLGNWSTAANFVLLELNEPISATEIRRLLTQRTETAPYSDESWDDLLGPKQWAYIQQHGLYY